MTLLKILLTATSLLLPSTGTAAARADRAGASVAARACSLDHSCCVIQRRADFPSPSRLFFETLDQTALDEEDTDEIEISAVISQAVFGENSSPTALLNPSSPRRLHSHAPSTQSVLRC
jgi:hypothetical protein